MSRTLSLPGTRSRLIRTIFLSAWVAVSLLLGKSAHSQSAPSILAKRLTPFILGADISWIPEDEAAGATYYDHDVQKDIFVILKEHQFNYIRLRIFVDPKAPGGYASRRQEAFCDLDHTKGMARRIKAAGMKFLLDFHLSDT